MALDPRAFKRALRGSKAQAVSNIVSTVDEMKTAIKNDFFPTRISKTHTLRSVQTKLVDQIEQIAL